MTDVMTELATEAPGAIHSTFRVSRTYPQAPERVFKAFEDTELVRRWRVEDDNCDVLEFAYDFRVGGTEVSRFVFPGGPEIRLDAQFQDIVANERIIFTYRMMAGPMLLSVSLSTVELKRSGRGTELTFTEQGVYFEGVDGPKNREDGTRFILEKLAKALVD